MYSQRDWAPPLSASYGGALLGAKVRQTPSRSAMSLASAAVATLNSHASTDARRTPRQNRSDKNAPPRAASRPALGRLRRPAHAEIKGGGPRPRGPATPDRSSRFSNRSPALPAGGPLAAVGLQLGSSRAGQSRAAAVLCSLGWHCLSLIHI